jgi:NAD(P)-dependent dehydrogenase (short-subunit alcohol dehydrogenase family)
MANVHKIETGSRMDEGLLAGRTLVVFGGTGALGSAVVEKALANGASVIVADATSTGVSNRHAEVRYVTVDALDEQSVASCFSSLDAAPWAVVNLIGGFAGGQSVADLDLSVLRRQFELNLVTAATITKYAVRSLATSGRGGRIVHTSSRVATEDGHNGFAYSVSKLAVVRLVEATAAEVRDDLITVNCVMPSIIDTPSNRSAMPNADYSKWPHAEQIAEVIMFLTSDAAEIVSGAAIPVYGRA